jgi:flagellar motility protein MotE (MotC chaperone)
MKRDWIAAGLVIGLLASTTSAEEPKGSNPKSPMLAEDSSSGKPGNAPGPLSVLGLSKGVDSVIAEVRKREIKLARSEQRVAERERAVAELEALIEKRSLELDRIRVEIEDRIRNWAGQGQDRVTQLSSVYSSMPPAKAGALLGKLELDLAVSIIRGMKKKSSAGVLAVMSSDRALKVSRRLLKPLDPRTDSPAAKSN